MKQILSSSELRKICGGGSGGGTEPEIDKAKNSIESATVSHYQNKTSKLS